MSQEDDIICHAVVLRVGELFGEFGFEYDARHLANDVAGVTAWNLRVDVEGFDGSSSPIFDKELPAGCPHKVVKLQPGRHFTARVRVQLPSLAWGPWSAAARTATLHAVAVEIKEVGEDYVRVQWCRPLRDTANIAAERDAESTQSIANIDDLELRIIRESNMVQEFCDRFAQGVRTYTVRGLESGVAFIVMIRYKTLINTMTNWTEVGRFYTKPRNIVSLVSRGEDVVTVGWCLGPSPVDAVGYTVSETTVYRYEVSIEGIDLAMDPVQLPEQEREYRVQGLSPGVLYTFYVRSVTIEGIWGNRSDPFKVRTADTPELSVVTSGETFLSFTWMRKHEEANESKVEYCLRSLSSRYNKQEIVDIGPRAEDKVFHIGGLIAGSDYNVSIRIFLQGEWGLWTEPKRFRTQSKAILSFLERGEDFFTLGIEDEAPKSSDGTIAAAANAQSSSSHFNVVVMKVGKDNERLVVLDQEIEHKPNEPGFHVGSLKADTLYEVKCRRWQYNFVTHDEGWGEFTSPIQTQTLQHLALHVWDIGEDFAQIVWKRGLSDIAVSQSQSQQVFPDLKYEVVVGCVDTGEDKIVHRQVLQTNYTITNLRPASTYIISVRACNELDQWGLWSKVKLRTLASVITSVHEIGEDFIRLMWQRENVEDDNDENNTNRYVKEVVEGTNGGVLCNTNNNNSSNTANGGQDNDNRIVESVINADMFVSRYAIFVCSREDGESIPSALSGYHMGGNSEVARYEVVTSEHTSLCIHDLLPDREYLAVVRASTVTGKWGLWSHPLRFYTNPQFRIPVNNLMIGENYVNLVWSRDAHPIVDKDVFLGDLSVTGQQLRIHGVDTQYSKDHTLPAHVRELKIYGLSPATAYTIQIRVCGKGGDWGRWSPPVHILTRDTILTRAVEVAEDYIIIAWERRKALNPKNYPTGRGIVTSYHLRVYNNSGIHSEVFLGDGDSPYRISNLTPDTYYCVGMKANYNDEEWGLWSTPLWCLTMKTLEIRTKLISEESCSIVIYRPYQQKRLPEDDGNPAGDDRIMAFGQFRPNLMLCVTSPILNPTPHTSTGSTKPRQHNSSLPPDAADHRLIYQTEIVTASDDTDHKIPNLRSNTVYSVSVRSKLVNGEWCIWSQPSLLFATVPTTQVEFIDIGEKFVKMDWRRSAQHIPPEIKKIADVKCGLGTISASRVKIREIGGSFNRTFELNNSLTTLRIDELSPASTYAVAVQTYNDNYEWGVWSEEGKVRTIPGMDIAVQHVSEDSIWVGWARKLDSTSFVNYDTALNVDVIPSVYEICIVGGGHFNYTKEMDTNTLFFRGLQPDTVYNFKVRAQSFESQEWGIWSSQSFRTKPRLRVTFGNVGEHFAIVEWRRHLPTSCGDRNNSTIVESEDVVEQFRLKVERVGSKATYVYDLSPYRSSFRLKDLQPSAEYRVWLCAKGFEGVWGFWNDEARVRTLPKLELDITAIGEDYVTVSWKRGKWMGETIDDNEASVREVDGAVSGYKVRVLDMDGVEVISQAIGFRESSCTISALNLSSFYSVEVSAKDTYNEWGLWSDAKHFMTLEAVDLRIIKVGEVFAMVEWGRYRELLHRRRTRRLRPKSLEAANEESQEEEEGGGEEDEEDEEDKEEEYGEEEDRYYDKSFLHGDDRVLQWHVRVQGQRVFGGQPGSEDFAELYVPADEIQRVIDSLLPHATYFVSVRAQDMGGSWGHWSKPREFVTYPLLSVNADNITETFIHVFWSRPPATFTLPEGFFCFPPVTDIHNYQVQIEPLATEIPFNEQDEPLVNGARVYETSQPSLRLCNLLPGVRYRILVREQIVDSQGNLEPDTWGCLSATQVVETVNPMKVMPIEIGEDYCLIGWHRLERSQDMIPDISVITGVGKVTAYELCAVRLDERALKEYHGPLALHTVIPLEAAETSYHLGNLVNNTIYALRIRAQTEGYWGPWSATTKFVSQSRLQVKVCAVYEDAFVVSWSRPLPEWALSRADSASLNGGTKPNTRKKHEPNVLEAMTEDENITSEGEDDKNDDFDAVMFGDYSVHRYELCVQGVTCNLQQCLNLPKEKMSMRIIGLKHNQIYSVCIRSQSEKSHWSMYSRWESLLTLTPICVEVSHYTETMASIRWFRAPQDVREYESLLQEQHVEEERRCDERERQDLFELKRRAQDMEESLERKYLSDHLAVRKEHNATRRMDAVHHLQIENITLGNANVTGYQLKFFGKDGECMPSIPGIHRMLLHTQKQGSARKGRQENSKRGATKQQRRQQQQQQPQLQNELAEGMSRTVTDGSCDCGGANVNDVGPAESTMNSKDNVSNEETPLIDVQLAKHVMSVVVKDLAPSFQFSVQLRARNEADEWCPWSHRESFTTLKPIELHQNRFGEHYINLFWHRMPGSFMQKMENDELKLEELNKEFSHFSPKDLEEKKEAMQETEYNELLDRLRSWRDLKRYVTNVRKQLSHGFGGVIVDENTPVKGYQLRIIHENGTFTDHYIDSNNNNNNNSNNSNNNNNYDNDRSRSGNTLNVAATLPPAADGEEEGDGNNSTSNSTTSGSGALVAASSATSPINCAFTVTGLTSNTMYVALLCADYGVSWGLWTTPLKFMTQNLIQLSITYISEVFVDIEWHRAPNKRLPTEDEGTTLISDAVSNEGHLCQICITYEDKENKGIIVEEYRKMFSCGVFRIDKLRTDTKYTFAVREWDAGDWGLWCAPKACVTLPGMEAKVEELGEDWAQITWRRQERCVDYDDDIDILQYDLEKVSYFLRVQEVPENDVDYDAYTLSLSHEDEVDMRRGEHNEELSDAGEVHGIFNQDALPCKSLPHQEYPRDYYGEKNGCQCLIRRFDRDIVSFKIENLRPDKFYSVRVMCETPENRLGTWSSHQYFLTMSKIKVTTEHIDEQYVDLSWKRLPPRQHPKISASCVFTGHYTTVSYILQVKSTNGFYFQEEIEGYMNTSYHLKGLSLNTIYTARIHSINDANIHSLWSETLFFITLDRIKIQPKEISEQAIMLEWGRDEQNPICKEIGEDYDPSSTSMCIGNRESGSYLLRVYQGGETSRNLLLEKKFPGDVCTFYLTSLVPNTPYVVSVRAANFSGEWGLWSKERCIYTMKLISTEIAAVGEDYIRFSWIRESPDELQIGDSFSSPRISNKSNNELFTETEGSLTHHENNNGKVLSREKSATDPTSSLSLIHASSMMEETNMENSFPNRQGTRMTNRKKYPLLDRPEGRPIVYNSSKTNIVMYAISVRRADEDEDYTIEIPGDATCFTIPSLRPDTRYSIAICARYGSGEWGVVSPCIMGGTLNVLTVELRGLGEDYLTAAWQRLLISYDISTVHVGKNEDTLLYEVAIHDFTDVSFGEEDNEDLAPRLRRTIFVPAKVRTCTVKELLSHHRYRVCVRRWYKPLETFVQSAPAEVPLIDDEQIIDVIKRNHAMPGTWGECLYDVTLRDMVCSMQDSAEDFIIVQWERDPRAQALPVRNSFAQMPVQGYHLRIDEMTSDGITVETGSNPTHIDQSLDAHETSYLAQTMKPDTLYRIDVRCCVDNVWGRWSRNLFVRTLPKLVIDISSIGEDYASFSWQRPRRNLFLQDGTEVFTGSDDVIDRFHFEIIGLEHQFHVSKKFKAGRNSYRVKHLEANTVYSVSVRSSDARRDKWSLWSDRVLFATLKPMRLVIGSTAEQFAMVEWDREEQTEEEFKETVGEGGDVVVQLGNPDVIAYHLCVFLAQYTPSLAVVDKQFPKDVTRYCIGGLTADTPYVAILRACNSESRWGFWSKEGHFRTQRLIDLSILSVGENCVRIKWERTEVDRTEDGRSVGIRAEPILYQLLLKADTETIERVVQPEDCHVTEDDFKLFTYVVEGLTPTTSYIMALQPCYEENRWGLWTPSISFKTLQPILITPTHIGSNSILLSLCRLPEKPVLQEEDIVGATENETPESPVTAPGSIVRYQLMVCKLDEHRVSGEKEQETDINPPLPIVSSLQHQGSTPRTLSAVAEPSMLAPEITPDLNIEGGEEDVQHLPSISNVVGVDPAVDSNMPAAGESDMPLTIEEKLVTVKDPVSTSVGGDEVFVHESRDRESLSRSGLMPMPSKVENIVLEREVEVNEEDPTNTVCELEDLESCTPYKVRVRALDENGMWGAWADMTLETAALPPHSVALHRINAQFCMLQWEAPDYRYPYCYVVEQASMPSDTRGKSKGVVDWRVVDTVTDTFCRVRFTLPPNKMRCRVKTARTGEGHAFSEFCEPVKLSSGSPPEPVTNLTVTAIARNFITVEWTQSRSEVTGSSRQARTLTYHVYLGIRERAPILVTTAPRTTTYTFEDLEPSTEYTVQIVVENADGLSYNNPMIRAATRGEGDETVVRHEPGQPPLGVIAEPLGSVRRTILPEIPSARATLIPQPPSQIRGARRKSRGRSVVAAAAGSSSSAPAAGAAASMINSRTGSVPQIMDSVARRGPGGRLPSLKKKH